MKKYSKILFASLGAAFEYYDLAIYYVFAVTMASKFFDQSNPSHGIILLSLIYLSSYIVKPLGAFIFGYLADKKGRVYVLRLNMILLFLSTLAISLLPDVNTIGVSAAILFVLLRFVQSLVIGSEVPIAIVFVTENYPQRRGLMVGVISFCLSLGIMMTWVVYFLLNHLSSNYFMSEYGWRVAFFIGSLFTLSLYFLRKGITDVSESYRSLNNIELKDYSFIPKVLLGIALMAFIAMIYSQLFTFLPSFAQVYIPGNEDIPQLLLIGSMFMAASAPIGGFISDYVSRTKMLTIIVVICMFLAPLFYSQLIAGKNLYSSFIFLSIVIGFFAPTYNIIIADFFKLKNKCRGLGLAYNLGYVIFSSPIPALTAYIVAQTSILYVPVYLIFFAGFITLIGVIITEIIKKKA